MATYPYISGSGPLVSAVQRLRKQFPSEVTADTLKKLGIAPKNESYVINILRFVGIIDEDGKRIEANTKAFFLSDDQFGSAFEDPVRKAYSALFDLYGEDAWTRTREELSTFFRSEDATSEVVGGRQAVTFIALASFAGHGEVAVPRTASSPTARKRTPKANLVTAAALEEPARTMVAEPILSPPAAGGSHVGLTVRVEVNLPATSDQSVYDAIFQSIRKNLIEGA